MKEGWCGDEDTGTCDESNQRIGIPSKSSLPRRESSSSLSILYFLLLFEILVLSMVYSLSFLLDSIQPQAYLILRSYTSIQGKEGGKEAVVLPL